MSNIKLQIRPDAFPILLKDIDLGLYLLESKIPDGTFDMSQVQVVLDNNVLGLATSDPEIFVQKIGWYYGLAGTVCLNPAIAFVEQYLSNDKENALQHIRSFEHAFEPFGLFPTGYSQNIASTIFERDVEIRQQVGSLFCFVALLRHWYKMPHTVSADPVSQWTNLFSMDIPRSGLMYWLGGMFLLSKMNSKLTLLKQDKPIEKYAAGFCDFRKIERDDYSRWLRNRVFDLLLFTLAPTLSFEELGGISSRTILASQDKFIGEFLGRLFAWYGEPKYGEPWRLAPLLRVIDLSDEKSKEGVDLLYKNYPTFRSPPDERVKEQRFRNLIDLALSTLIDGERRNLYQALNEYRIFESLVGKFK